MTKSDDTCAHCGEDDSVEIKPMETCDTHGGDYSYESIRKCNVCKKNFKVYFTEADDGRMYYWDRKE